jgi:long-chain-fatty-acid--CoA ligase ACSBG
VYSITCIYTELIAIGTGLKIHPIPIETEMKKEIPLVRNMVVIGEGRKYLSCLLTLKVRTNIYCMILG